MTDPLALDSDLTVAEQVDVNTGTHVVLTLLHFGHAGGLALLPASGPVLVQRREWHPAAIKRNGSLPIDYDEPEREVILVDENHDVFGDGSITLMLIPGHTAGHQSVRIGDELVLGTDVTYFDSGLDDQRFPVYGDDHEQQVRSAARLRALCDAASASCPATTPMSSTPVYSRLNRRASIDVRTLPLGDSRPS